MEFKKFRDAISWHLKKMTEGANPVLFVSDVDRDELWNKYLASFPAGSDPKYRERTQHDCGICRHFIKNVGNLVTIKDGVVTTIWDVEAGDPNYQIVANALSEFVKSKPIANVFVTDILKFGVKQNFENLNGVTTKYNHFEHEFPASVRYRGTATHDTVRGQFRDTKAVFQRSLEEISEDAVLTILELINQNSLYKGEEWKTVLNEFLKHKRRYDRVADTAKDLYAWENSVSVGIAIGRIRNHSIGVLLQELSEGGDLDAAVQRYEAIVAPTNYKRPKAIFTKKMLEDATKTITELGYIDSLPRRYARLDDITVNNILFSNKDSAKRIAGASDILGGLEKEVKSDPKKFSRLEEISIDKFVSDVLPGAKELEVYFENKHSSNMVSLIAPINGTAPTMFKWGNAFSWAYSGNITDSHLKDRVKAAGGSVTGDLRFSIQWNDGKEHDGNDLDAHCIEPNGGQHIYFGNKCSSTGGQLDIDIIHPNHGTPAVENITWPSRDRMKKGTYKFYVNNFSNNGGRGGFRAEIEFDGQIFSFDYPKGLRQSEDVQVAEVTLNSNGTFTIVEKLPSSLSSKDIWNLKTNQFVPAGVVMYSPNYWDEQDGIGHRHYFFMLKGCVNSEQPNGFYNEFLKPELEKHRRVFEALGAKAKVEFTEDQLSGIGFSATKRSELVVKVKGQTERVLKIMF